MLREPETILKVIKVGEFSLIRLPRDFPQASFILMERLPDGAYIIRPAKI